MTTKIYSKIDPTKLLHMVVRDIPEGRVNLCDNEMFLQCASLNLKQGTTFKAHKHNWNTVNEARIAQESWIVLQGSVKCFFYDTNGALLAKEIIGQHEASFSFEGYHNYLLLEDSKILEYKTGRYVSQEHDKTFL